MHSTFRQSASVPKRLVSTALLATIGSLLFPSPVSSQALPPMPVQFNPDTLRSPGRPGGRRRGGGSRGGCVASDIPLSAIAYSDTQTSQALGVEVTEESVGSFTTQSQPLLWFYMPRAISENSGAELIVKNEQNEVIYSRQLAGETTDSGIISAPIAIEMTPGSAYRWALSLNCDEAASESVEGWIVREEAQPEANRLIAQAEPRNRVALYTNYGYIQDALSELAALRLADRDNLELAEDWVTLLSGLGLEDLTAAPLLDCCELAGLEADTPEPAPVEAPAPEREEPQEPSESIIERARDRGRSPLDR